MPAGPPPGNAYPGRADGLLLAFVAVVVVAVPLRLALLSVPVSSLARWRISMMG